MMVYIFNSSIHEARLMYTVSSRPARTTHGGVEEREGGGEGEGGRKGGMGRGREGKGVGEGKGEAEGLGEGGNWGQFY